VSDLPVSLPADKKLVSTAEAAEILGVSMGRVRQLADIGPEKGGLSSWLAAATARVYDEAEVRARAARVRKTGRPAGGFKKN